MSNKNKLFADYLKETFSYKADEIHRYLIILI